MHFKGENAQFIVIVICSYLGQKVTSSMMGGKMMASVDDDTAPTREMNSPMFGMAAARITESKWKLPIVSHKLLRNEGS